MTLKRSFQGHESEKWVDWFGPMSRPSQQTAGLLVHSCTIVIVGLACTIQIRLLHEQAVSEPNTVVKPTSCISDLHVPKCFNLWMVYCNCWQIICIRCCVFTFLDSWQDKQSCFFSSTTGYVNELTTSVVLQSIIHVSNYINLLYTIITNTDSDMLNTNLFANTCIHMAIALPQNKMQF